VITVPADINSLTSKQKKVYYAIETYTKTKGIPPTVREIGEMLGEKTPGAVQVILNRLEQKGVIKREIGMARSIQIVSEDTQYAKPIFIPEFKKITRRNLPDLFNMYNIIKYQPFPNDILHTDDKSFIIDCPDNSLYDSGITYDDKIIISTTEEYKDGDIILLSYENHILLRRYYKSDNDSTVILRADSDLLEKEVFNKSEITVVGKMIGKITRY
jgi:repressor LexA